MSYPRLAGRLYNSALLITPGKAEVIEQVFRAHAEGRPALLSPAPEAAPKHEFSAAGVTRTDAGYLRTADGVAIVPVIGTLVQRAGGMDAMSGLTGYNQLAGQLQAALEDPRVGAILLEIDSPGGEANGAFDLQAKIAAAAKKKPMWAIANEQAFSAAYLLASGAEKLFVPAPGMVGSIGVVMLHVDQSQRDAKSGLVYTPIFAGSHKVDFSSHAPLSEDALAEAQTEVERVYGLFVDAVASGRNVDPQAVRDTQAALLNPSAAFTAGLIDGIQSFDETLAQLAAEAQHVRIHGMRAAASARASAPALPAPTFEGDIDMAAPDNTAATAAQLAEAEARGAEKAKAEAETESAKTIAEAQGAASKLAQDRVATILEHPEAIGRAGLARYLAFKTSTGVEECVALLAAASKESAMPTNPLAAAMGNVPNPKVGASAGDSDSSRPAPWSNAKIFEYRKECVANARAGKPTPVAR